MNIHPYTRIVAITFFAAIAIPLGLAAQDVTALAKKVQHHHYQLIDIGTLGGPQSYVDVYTETGFVQQDINNRGIEVGSADTPTLDPFSPQCFNQDCHVSHTFRWQNGVLTDMGALPGGGSSLAAWVSGNGRIAGESQNGAIDPIKGMPEFDAVLWSDGRTIDLGTLGGTLSAAFAVNNAGQVVGGALNLVPDPVCLESCEEQLRAFLWQNGVMQDLGTLGGPDAGALFINERKQVAGWSFTNSTPNPVTLIPTQDPFLWKNGRMLDLGTLGGTLGFPNGLNNRGEVIGVSNLKGDLTSHPFLWTVQGGMQDLGTFGGSNGQAISINDAGAIAGEADFLGDQVHDAFVWNNGVLTDLGNLGLTSFGFWINNVGQVVGHSHLDEFTVHAFVWQNGGPMVDLNALIPADSDAELTDAVTINDKGEIAALGLFASGDTHAFLLIPCDGDHPGIVGCDYSMVDAAEVANNAVAPRIPHAIAPAVDSLPRTINPAQKWFRQHYRMFGQHPTISH